MMRRLLGGLFAIATLLACAMVPAAAQNTTGLVVSVCGTPPSPFVAGRPGPFTVDVTGTLCTGGTGGGSAATAANQTAVQGPVAPATATATKSQLGGCQGTTAAVTFANGQQGTVSCDANGNILVSSGGAPNFATTQVSVLTTSTATVAARALRRSVTITNITGAQQVYCSGTTATSANGQLIPAVVGASFTVSTTAAVNCIALTAAQTVSVAETF